MNKKRLSGGWSIWAMAALGICVHVPVAHADDPLGDRSVVVVVTPLDEGNELSAAMVEAIGEQGFEASVSEAKGLGRKIDGCVSKSSEAKADACAARLFRRQDASTVVVVRADRGEDDQGEPRVMLYGRLMEKATGATLFTSERVCGSCHDAAQLTRLARSLAVELIRDLAFKRAPNSAVRVLAKPGDALVELDGEPAGPAGSPYRVPPGPLDVKVQKEGYKSWTKQVQVRPNQELLLEVELVAEKSGPTDPENGVEKPEPYHRSKWPWIAGGAGVASLGLGVTWLIAHQEPVENGVRLQRRRNTLTRGIVATSIGGVLLGVGAVLLYRDRKAEERSRSRLQVAPTREGAMVTWSGSF